MLPQTNLQLYRVLLDRGADQQSLVRVRTAYDLARQLFAGCYRPSHKPFLCHLVGTAGALATWGQPTDVVLAGLLHSAYLYGIFGDGARGMSAAKRRIVRDCVGDASESLILAYTRQAWNAPLERLTAALQSGVVAPVNLVIKLADLCDECVDAGPAFAPAKPLEFGLPGNRHSRCAILKLLENVAGSQASIHFASVLASADEVQAPLVLATSDRSFNVVAAGIAGMRQSRIRMQLRRLIGGFAGQRAA